jgi:hypothetical protein
MSQTKGDGHPSIEGELLGSSLELRPKLALARGQAIKPG